MEGTNRIILNMGDGTCYYTDDYNETKRGTIVTRIPINKKSYCIGMCIDEEKGEFKISYFGNINSRNILKLCRDYNLSVYKYLGNSNIYQKNPERKYTSNGTLFIKVPLKDDILINVNRNFIINNHTVYCRRFNELVEGLYSRSKNEELNALFKIASATTKEEADKYQERLTFLRKPIQFIPEYFTFDRNKFNKLKVNFKSMNDIINRIDEIIDDYKTGEEVQSSYNIILENFKDIYNGKCILLRKRIDKENNNRFFTVIDDLEKIIKIKKDSEYIVIRPKSIHKGYIGSYYIFDNKCYDIYYSGDKLTFKEANKFEDWRYHIENPIYNFDI